LQNEIEISFPASVIFPAEKRTMPDFTHGVKPSAQAAAFSKPLTDFFSALGSEGLGLWNPDIRCEFVKSLKS
jgi:hypothetical protein